MSCTIVSTPATGSQDWTDWIIQQGLTDRGFSRVSLTNFAGSTASAIGTGSVFELAGSIYNNTTETAISLAAGTASASVAVYILAIPAAGGTTCTFQLDSTAPTWIDAKQGFYASAASTTRYLGGMYIGTAATYFTKFVYTPEMIYGFLLSHGGTRPLLKTIVELGEWNMDTTNTVVVQTGVPHANIRRLSAIIINDTGANYDEFAASQDVTGGDTFEIIMFGHATNIVSITRDAGGQFDNAGWSGSANRGFLYIDHIA